MLPSHRAKSSSLSPLYLSTTLRRLPCRVETEALNPHRRRRPPSPDSPTLNLHCYKKVISTLTALPITQSRLHFTSSLARAPRHQSSTHHRRFLSPLSHVHRPSIQWHSRCRTSQPSFDSQTIYRHVNSCKKIFWNSAASHGIIN
jgi:hypothetical protein